MGILCHEVLDSLYTKPSDEYTVLYIVSALFQSPIFLKMHMQVLRRKQTLAAIGAKFRPTIARLTVRRRSSPTDSFLPHIQQKPVRVDIGVALSCLCYSILHSLPGRDLPDTIPPVQNSEMHEPAAPGGLMKLDIVLAMTVIAHIRKLREGSARWFWMTLIVCPGSYYVTAHWRPAMTLR